VVWLTSYAGWLPSGILYLHGPGVDDHEIPGGGPLTIT
jgi:hypothetical protein